MAVKFKEFGLESENGPFDDTLPEEIRKGKEVKFVLLRLKDDVSSLIANLFQSSQYHHRQVQAILARTKELEFVGAGLVKNFTKTTSLKKPEVVWDSDTCRDTFGFDKPEDEVQAQAILEELQSLLDENYPEKKLIRFDD